MEGNSQNSRPPGSFQGLHLITDTGFPPLAKTIRNTTHSLTIFAMANRRERESPDGSLFSFSVPA
jgi:hypothetical protein